MFRFFGTFFSSRYAGWSPLDCRGAFPRVRHTTAGCADGVAPSAQDESIRLCAPRRAHQGHSESVGTQAPPETSQAIECSVLGRKIRLGQRGTAKTAVGCRNQLVPGISTEVATAAVTRWKVVARNYSNYNSHSIQLESPFVKTKA